MLRRLTALAIVWVSLLTVASPAFACSLIASAMGDCCPEGAPSPCTGGEGFTQALDGMPASCCASTHVSSAVMIVGSERAAHERGHLPRLFPHALVPVACTTRWMATASARLTPAVPIRSPRSDAALIYLHTARLRL